MPHPKIACLGSNDLAQGEYHWYNRISSEDRQAIFQNSYSEFAQKFYNYVNNAKEAYKKQHDGSCPDKREAEAAKRDLHKFKYFSMLLDHLADRKTKFDRMSPEGRKKALQDTDWKGILREARAEGRFLI